jgi:hypothetical protein
MSLAVMSSGLPEWLSFLAVGGMAALILVLAWRLVRVSEGGKLPSALAWLVIGAALLHLAVGIFWYYALPALGHKTPAEEAGYVMADAHQRDQAAWSLAQSDQSLWSAFRNNRAADQYGGMLFLSSLIYRTLGGAEHQPLLMVVLAAAFSSLAVLFAWALARRACDERVAMLSAWVMLLYPEVVLLGSSQMREAFLIPLATASFYGLARYLQANDRTSLAWLSIPLVLMLPFSPPSAALTLGFVALGVIYAGGWRLGSSRARWVAWLVAIGVVILVLAVVWLALRQFAPEDMTNPWQVVQYWLRKSADLQAYLAQHSSGWLQKVLKSVPEWLQLPLLVGYGVVQPFLPAALIATSSAPLWTGVAIWRAAGWSFILALLLYASLLAFRRQAVQSRLMQIFVVAAWLGILVASFRGGGDQWDNPRYRAVFVGVQIVLVSWAWVEARRRRDPWFRRAWVALLCVLLWFVPWYLRRYTPLVWPVVDLFKTIGLGLATAALLTLWDWLQTSRPRAGATVSPSDGKKV